VGHELYHGVTEFSAGLVYAFEPGALNESFSDIFGKVVENYATGSNNWLLGDDIGLNGSGAFRNMENPNQFDDPDTYLGDFWYVGGDDNGGVHTNSGVQNKWFQLLTDGGTGTNDNGEDYDVIGIGIDDASGDDDPFDEIHGTFNQLFPLGHAHFGFADAIGRQNIVAPSLSVSTRPTQRLRVSAAIHGFRRESRADAVYNAGGGVVAAGSAGTSRSVASEFDIVAAVLVAPRLTLEIGTSRVFTGRFLEQAGLTGDMTFAYTQLEFRF